IEDPVDPVAREQADQIILGREEEAALARVALASGAPAQLIVDAPRLMALGADDVQPAGFDHALAILLEPRLEGGQQLDELLVEAGGAGAQAEFCQFEAYLMLGVPAQLDVDTAAGHVRRDRDRAHATCFGDRRALTLGVFRLRVEHRVLDAAPAQTRGEQFGDLDGDRADEHRLPGGVARGDLAFDRRPLALLGLVDLIVAVGAGRRASSRGWWGAARPAACRSS